MRQPEGTENTIARVGSFAANFGSYLSTANDGRGIVKAEGLEPDGVEFWAVFEEIMDRELAVLEMGLAGFFTDGLYQSGIVEYVCKNPEEQSERISSVLCEVY
jgi:hypothetical protein